jgi:PPOX class probable F420-dependent enzyme
VPDVESLLQSPAPAVLTTYRRDGSALTTPVWFRHRDGAFELVIAKGDVKLGHLERDPRCLIVVFEAVPPFRGVAVNGTAELVDCDVRAIREDISGRYLGTDGGRAYAAQRKKPGVLVRITGEQREWDLSGMLPEV